MQLKNARKIYSITVSYISWKAQDLANVFNAKCGERAEASHSSFQCKGLSYELEVASGAKRQHLVVSASHLTLALRGPLRSFAFDLDHVDEHL